MSDPKCFTGSAELADEFIKWVEQYAAKICPPGCLPLPTQEREINLFARITIAIRGGAQASPLQAAYDLVTARIKELEAKICDDGSKALPVRPEPCVPCSPPGGSGAENPTTLPIAYTLPKHFADAYIAARKMVPARLADEIVSRNSSEGDGSKMDRIADETDAEFVIRIVATYLAVSSTQREGEA